MTMKSSLSVVLQMLKMLPQEYFKTKVNDHIMEIGF